MGSTSRPDPDPTPMGAGPSRMRPGDAERTRTPGERDRLEVFFDRVEASVPARIGPPKLIRAMVRLAAVPLLMLVLIGLVALFRTDMLPATLARLGTLLFIGKLAAIGGQDAFLFWSIVLGTADVLFGLFFILNFDLLKDIPYVGRWVHRTLDKTVERVQRRPALRRLSLLGVAAIVTIPVHGTGTITGSLMGRIMGLGPTRTLVALAIGSYVGVVLVLAGSFAAVSLMANGGGALVVAIGAFLGVAWVVGQHIMDARAARSDPTASMHHDDHGRNEQDLAPTDRAVDDDGLSGQAKRRRFPAG